MNETGAHFQRVRSSCFGSWPGVLDSLAILRIWSLLPLGLHKDQCGERISDSMVRDTLNMNLQLHSSGYVRLKTNDNTLILIFIMTQLHSYREYLISLIRYSEKFHISKFQRQKWFCSVTFLNYCYEVWKK